MLLIGYHSGLFSHSRVICDSLDAGSTDHKSSTTRFTITGFELAKIGYVAAKRDATISEYACGAPKVQYDLLFAVAFLVALRPSQSLKLDNQ